MDSDTNSWVDASLTGRRVSRTVLATIGHELRSPVTAIRGYVETLLEGDFDPVTARRFLETVRRQALRLGRLVDGMLEFSLLDVSAGQDPSACNVAEQIGATIEMLSPLALRRGVTIGTHVGDNVVARVDGDACVHALANLIENAIKHGEAGGSVEVSCVREPPYVSIAVEDAGGGVRTDRRDRIFLMGVRDEKGPSGCGIGLAIVKAIAQSAGGDVSVEPSPLGGARFVLRFLEG